MKKQLIINNVLILLAGFLAAFFAVSFFVRGQYQQEFTRRLDAVLAALSSHGDIWDSPQRFAREAGACFVGEGQEIRVTVLNEAGDVVGDSGAAQAGALQNHFDRPEIRMARETGRGYDTRASASFGIPYSYAAKKIDGGYLRAAIPVSDLDGTIHKIWLDGAIAALLGAAAVCFVTVLFAQRMAEPVRRMSEAAKQIAQGDFASRVKGEFRDEFAELADSFNAMADNTETAFSLLRTKQEQLEGVLQGMGDGVLAVNDRNRLIFLNQSARAMLGAPQLSAGGKLRGSLLIRRLSEIMAQTARAREVFHGPVESPQDERQYEVYAAPMEGQKRPASLLVLTDVTKLRRLERLRSEFVSNVTHELKTPLTSIRGGIELLRSADRDEETRRYFYDVIDIEAERLYRLIEDMLVLSRIEGAREDPDMRSCSLRDALERCLNRARPLAEKQNIALYFEMAEPLYVACTPSRLEQLFGNLIENAVKYNVPGGSVFVRAQTQRQMAVIGIRDTGIGIAREHLGRLFERFYRVDTSRSREIGGTGLGLSIVKHLVQLYGGEISVESEPERGSVFTVRLPAVAGDGEA